VAPFTWRPSSGSRWAWSGDRTRQLQAGTDLRTFVEREHAAVAVGVHLDGQVEGRAGLQFPEEVHHAGVAREHLQHHVALVSKVSPARAVVHVSPDDPDRVLVAVERLQAAHDAGRLVELHLLDDPLELVGLLSRWERRPFLRECNSAKEEERENESSEGFHCYLSGRMALWAALTSWSGNTPRIRTATD